MKTAKAAELAELMFRDSQEKQIKYARWRYTVYSDMLTQNAFKTGFSCKEWIPMLNKFLDDLEAMFGKETFNQIDRPKV